MKSIRLGHAMVSGICLVLFLTVTFAGIYPCGYWAQHKLFEKEGYAGCSYESLATVIQNGFFWEADEVPIENGIYEGDGPFYVVGYWWVTIFYIPIYIGIIYLGYLISERWVLDWGFNHLSKM